MSDLSTLLEFDWRNGILFLAAIVIVAVFAIQKFDWIVERFGFKSRRQLAEEKQNRDIDELRNHAKKTDDNIDKILSHVEKMGEQVNEISEQVKRLRERMDESDRSTLGDRLTQAYNFYRKSGQWTQIQKWAFDGMVKSYKQSGGDSWIDEVVVPTSRTWEIIDE